MYPGPNTETRTGYAQNTQDTYRIQFSEGYTQDTSGYIKIHQDTGGRNRETWKNMTIASGGRDRAGVSCPSGVGPGRELEYITTFALAR